MRRVALLISMITALQTYAQPGPHSAEATVPSEMAKGSISGMVRTTDGSPAAFVSIYIKENNRTALTDGSGNFIIRNVREGSYTLQVSMVGLKPQQKTVVVEKERNAAILIVLVEDAGQLLEVIVSSGRRLNTKPVEIGKIGIAPMDLPQSITVVAAPVIREQQAQRLSDIVKNVNGVYGTNNRGNVQEGFGARGYAFGSNNLFKNGARINSGVMPEVSSLEKVEVLKGSTAILFGQVAPGGILNMVTREPKFESGGEVSLRAGSFRLLKPAFDLYGPLSSAIAYRLNGTYETAGSFRDGVHSKRYYVHPSLLFKWGARTTVTAEGDFLYHRFTPDFGIGSINNTSIPDVPRSRFFGTDWQYNKTAQTTSTLSINHVLNDHWKLNGTGSYQYYKRDYYGVEKLVAAANGDWIRPLGKVFTHERYYAGQVNLNGKFSTGTIEHLLLAGADADHSTTGNHDFNFPAVAGLPAGSYDKINIFDPKKFTARTDVPVAMKIREREAMVNRYGAYVQDLVRLDAHWNVLAGIRWTYVSAHGIDSLNLLTGVQTKGRDRSDKAFSPRLGLVYKPSGSVSLFASYSNSFVVNSGQDMDGNTLKPSRIDQYELGSKADFFSGRLSANITLYKIINNQLAQTAPFLKDGRPNSNTNIRQLTGETTSDGLEIDFAGHPLKGLNITAGYSYNFMRYTRTDTTVGSFREGERLVNNPAHTANAAAFYTAGNGRLKGLKAGVLVTYTGRRFGGWNTDVVSVNPVTYRNRLIAVKGYATVDLSLGYAYKKFSFLAKLSNITNALSYSVHENYSINPIAPRQLMATVSYVW